MTYVGICLVASGCLCVCVFVMILDEWMIGLSWVVLLAGFQCWTVDWILDSSVDSISTVNHVSFSPFVKYLYHVC